MRPAPTKPVSIGIIAGKHLRFFRSPQNHGVDFPWHSVDDLYACLAIPRDMRRDFQRRLRGEWKADVVTVATPDGITTIAPHYMAQGLIGAMAELRVGPADAEKQYALAGKDAMDVITASMPHMAAGSFAVAAALYALTGRSA